MGVALPRPSGLSNIAEKILYIFIDHNLLDGERILFKYPIFIFAKKGVDLPRPSGWQDIAKNFLKF